MKAIINNTMMLTSPTKRLFVKNKLRSIFIILKYYLGTSILLIIRFTTSSALMPSISFSGLKTIR